MEPEHKEALRLSDAGRFGDAEALLRDVIAKRRTEGKANLQDHLLLGLSLFNAGRFEETAVAFREATRLFPKEPSIFENLGVTLIRLGRIQEAVQALEKSRALGNRTPNLMDGLANCYGRLGRLAEARAEGVAALLAKDQQANKEGKVFPLPKGTPPPFDPTQPNQNIISFSLWGSDPRYTQSALRNALLTPDIYPGWTARFYVDDSVPETITKQLASLRAEVIQRPKPKVFYEGLLWRFEVASDPEVRRFLVRDADAVINTQERAAVDEWLASGRYFHILRDWISHTDLILAGLWGGVGGVLPPVTELLSAFRNFRAASPTFDQDLLRFMVWPTARQSCLIHDSHFDCLDSRPFPKVGRLPAGMHVGQDARARKIRKARREDSRR